MRVFVVVNIHVSPPLLFACIDVFACGKSVDRNVARARDVCYSDRPQQLDERVDLLFISRRFDDHLCVRDIDHLRAKYTHQTQHFLTFSPRARGNSDQRHLAFDVRASRDILDLAHARQPFALFDDLMNCAVITSRDDRDPRPARIETLTDRNRLDIESSRTKQSDDPRQLSRLISNNY